MIKVFGTSLLIVCIMSCVACSNKNKKRPLGAEVSHYPYILISDIKKSSIIGELGIPLGEPAKIRAIIVDGESMKDKIHSSSYLLKVTEVNGVKMTVMPILEFSLDHANNVGLAMDNFQLFYMRYEKEAEELTSDQIIELKNGYVGKSVSLLVYETGAFSGMPGDLPDGVDLWQDQGFCFETKIEVLSELSLK